MEEKKEKSNRTIAIPIILIIIFIIIILYFLLSGRETHTTDGGDNSVTTALNCTAGSIDGSFFTSSTANSVENQVKITFKEDKPDKWFYSYDGTYRDYGIAEQDNAVLHAKYNKYLGGNDINHEIFTPTFSTVKTKLRINLYAKESSMINRITAVLFFINGDNYEEILDYSRDQIADYYQKQGFSCEKQN